MKKNVKKRQKFSKRVFTKRILCGKLWEKSKWGKGFDRKDPFFGVKKSFWKRKNG